MYPMRTTCSVHFIILVYFVKMTGDECKIPALEDSNIRIVGSNHARVWICVLFFCVVSFVGGGLVTCKFSDRQIFLRINYVLELPEGMDLTHKWIIMSTGWDYVSELRPPTGLLFISPDDSLYEHGEPWWDDIDRGNSWFVHQSPWQSYQQSHIVAKQEELGEGN
jgi:hypothetical protein